MLKTVNHRCQSINNCKMEVTSTNNAGSVIKRRKTVTTYRCKFCKTAFHLPEELIDHKKKNHMAEVIAERQQRIANGDHNNIVTTKTACLSNSVTNQIRNTSPEIRNKSTIFKQLKAFNNPAAPRNVTCQPCQKTFADPAKLFKLNKNVHPSTMIGCPFCPYISFTAQIVRRHVTNVHAPLEGKRFMCRLCNGCFYSYGALSNHSSLCCQKRNLECNMKLRILDPSECYQKSLKCQYCPFTAFSSTHIGLHVQSSHYKKKFKCTGTHLSIHTNRVHSGRTTASDVMKAKVSSTTVVTTPVPQVKFSNSTLPKGRSLRIQERMEKKRLKEIPTGNNTKMIGCGICYKVYNDQNALIIHMRKAHSKPHKYYPCSHCEYTSPFSSNVKSHIQRIHNEDTVGRVKCPHCAGNCHSQGSLVKHIQMVHGNIPKKTRPPPSLSVEVVARKPKPVANEVSSVNTKKYKHQCSKCPMLFSSPKDVRRHIESVHTTKQQFSCDMCSASYQRQIKLRFHKRCHLQNSSITNENNDVQMIEDPPDPVIEQVSQAKVIETEKPKKFTCVHCPSTFRMMAQLNLHLHKNHQYS